MPPEKQELPINLNLTIAPASLKKIVEQGRLMEFVDALSTQASVLIREQVIDQVARGAVAGGSVVSVRVGFDDDDRYGTVPPHKGPFPPKGIWEDAMRQVAINALETRMTVGR